MKNLLKKYGKQGLIIYLLWCTVKGIAFLAVGKYMIF